MGFINLVDLARNVLLCEFEHAEKNNDDETLSLLWGAYAELDEVLLRASTPALDALLEKVGYKYEY